MYLFVLDPTRLHEEFTRYHLFLQVRRDLAERRLSAPTSTLCLLTSYALQSVVGDYDDDNPENFDSVGDLRKLCHLQTASSDGGGLGSSARTSSLLAASLALGQMLRQEDREWFFKADESPYVAAFVQVGAIMMNLQGEPSAR